MIVYRKTVLYSTVFVSSMDIQTFRVPAVGVSNSSKKMHKKLYLRSWIDHVWSVDDDKNTHPT